MLRSNWFWPAVIALCACLAVISALDPTGEYPGNGEGPGLSLDEQFNVVQGVMMFDRLLAFDEPGFRTAVNSLPDHPLLGRLWLGFVHEVAYAIYPPQGQDASRISLTCARIGSALAFAMLVFLIGWCGSRWYGRRAGIVAALAMVLMPRVFGHAHLAALESCVNLTWCATVLYLAEFATRDRPPVWWQIGILGILLGLALLTKIQAVLLPLPLGLWMIYRWRWSGLAAAVVWGLLGVAVFFAGWPWLWDAPLLHAEKFFASSTKRISLSVWYFGTKYIDRDVPWHYPWVMFLTTVPLGLQLLGFAGLRSGAVSPKSETGTTPPRSDREILLLVAILFPLTLFSIPGVAVYDGERLFLMVFPLWALFIGRGADWVADRFLAQRPQWLVASLLGLFLALQSYGIWALSPCHLSYYNLLVGGLRGADRIGLPVTYWGESITRSFLHDVAAQVPVGGEIRFNPVVHTRQLPELQQRSVSLQERKIHLEPYNTDGNLHPPYLLVFLRKDSLPEEFRQVPEGAELAAELRREGVLLAALYCYPPSR